MLWYIFAILVTKIARDWMRDYMSEFHPKRSSIMYPHSGKFEMSLASRYLTFHTNQMSGLGFNISCIPNARYCFHCTNIVQNEILFVWILFNKINTEDNTIWISLNLYKTYYNKKYTYNKLSKLIVYIIQVTTLTFTTYA